MKALTELILVALLRMIKYIDLNIAFFLVK